MVGQIKIIWNKKALKDLEIIHHFYVTKSESAAKKVIANILRTVENIIFEKQYQTDEILGVPYRRMVTGHYRIVYKPHRNSIVIFRIFDTRQNPNNLD